MRLLLIRHAQTIDNVTGSLGSILPGPGLTELGQQQAEAIPAALAGEDIAAIYVSTMRRTQETAVPLAAKLGMDAQIIAGIQEISAGDLEGNSDKDSVRTYMGTIFAWWQDFNARFPGGEDGNEFYARFTGAIDALAEKHGDDTVVVFSHGAAIRTWASWASANIDAAFSRVHDLPNTATVTLEGSSVVGWIATHWDGEPVGGAELNDASAPDPTGEAD
jgi:broad specificity phosphatase PhoE